MIHALGVDTRSLPSVRFASNGRYTVMLHDGGGGWSRWQGLALNDWSWDGRTEAGAPRFYLRDLDDGSIYLFGAASGPGNGTVLDHPEGLLVVERQGDLELHMVVSVASAWDCEIRQLTVHNRSSRSRRLEITVYLPLALHQPAVHRAHPAFSRLFVETEFLAEAEALLARRRPRADGEASPCCIARLLGPGSLRWDSERAGFLGRGWSDGAPRGVVEGAASGEGKVLDPALALQRGDLVAPGGQVQWTLVVGAAEGREAACRLASQTLDTLRSSAGVGRAQPEGDDRRLAEALAGDLFYRQSPAPRETPPGHPSVVWRWGLPTDRPSLLVRAAGGEQVLAAGALQAVWQSLGLSLPILVLMVTDRMPESRPVGLLVQPESAVPKAEQSLLEAVAARVLPDSRPSSDSLSRALRRADARSVPARRMAPLEALDASETLQFDNGLGGFAGHGRHYVIRLRGQAGRLRLPPVPWVNILANPGFGAIVSETGAGCTWSVNSHQRRLTHWANDPVQDPPQETFWLQDRISGLGLSPLPACLHEAATRDDPKAGDSALVPVLHEVRHGFGHTRFRCRGNGLDLQTTVFVHRSLPVKIYRMEIDERLGVARTLSLQACQRLVLGFLPEETWPHLRTRVDWDRRVLVSHNPLSGPFAERCAFAALVADGDLQGLTWHPGEGRDFEQSVVWQQPPGSRVVISLLFGEVGSEPLLPEILQTLDSDAAIQAALAEVDAFWADLLETIQVETPAADLDVMFNGWLLYQTLSCRLWGRTALYQSSGAYGFRDQLQDSGAFLQVRPQWTREQILRHAGRQFREGDVQHWWHEPPLDCGLRTRFADDLNWLPWLTAQYLQATGDLSLLDESIPFLEAPLLQPGEDEAYQQASASGGDGLLYEHCCRALDRSLTQGEHGLPLMGTGDWNDGMNRVGRAGRGESVWMGFFLFTILDQFLPYAEQRGDTVRVARYRAYRDHLRTALDNEAWDGQWYRRAWYDNGAVLGSATSDECRIDALVQAWAVFSGAAPSERVGKALEALENHLVDREGGLIRLLTPPFVNTPNDPGYIKGYVAGVRENGGQYTHAATWVVKAMAAAGRRDQVADLYRLLLPIAHARDAEGVGRYQTEPYVVVADVYGVSPHVGRGGWTWYTGSSGWMYRVGLESLLGLTLEDGRWLRVCPCIPAEWPGFRVRYRTPAGGMLLIQVRNGGEGHAVAATLDGVALAVDGQGVRIPLDALDRHHQAEIDLG